MLQDLSGSVLQAQTLSHIAGYKSVSVFQAVKMSVCCKLSHCQCFTRINIYKCVAGSHNVSVL